MNCSCSQTDSPFPPGLFAGTAEYYVQYRIPYPAVLIDGLADAAKLTGTGRLLDLGSGPGRVALPMARYFHRVTAVDPEPEMIQVGRRLCKQAGVQNVDWQIGRAEDVNYASGSCEMITIGEAFHRMDRPLVARRAMEWLGPGKCLALMGCNSVWTGKENWQKLAVEVIARWTKPKGSNSDHAQVPSPRPYREIFEEAGFVDVINQRFPIRHAWTLDSFIGYLYSTSVASKRVLGDHVNDFENDLRSELLKYDSAGCYTETLEFYYDLTRRPR